jgi:hypothetical protein
LKSHVLTNIDGTPGPTIQYLLGDLFHSNPVVIGSPVNVPFWVGDLYSDGTECTDDETGNPGYRCYFARHRFRRKVLLAGANDGMLHAFDAGRFRENGTDPATGRTLNNEFNNGTGHELFAFIPRSTLPTVKTRAQGTSHQYGVDGTPVAADIFMDAAHSGTPSAIDRRWRTVVIGALREGGVGYYALDLTQPDKLKTSEDFGAPIPDDNGASNWLPSCMTDYSASVCGPTPYAAPLWEWSDTTDDSHLVAFSLPLALAMDEDRNGLSDLGTGWSSANIGRIRVCRSGGTHCEAEVVDPDDGTDVIDMFVAIFGGGLDPDAADKTLPSRGNWLYMLDIETGKTIYKRELCSPASQISCINPGSVASEPAAVDTNLDGYIDRIYVATTGGFIFRTDLKQGSSGKLPALTEQTVAAIDPDTGAPFDLTAIRVQRDDLDAGERLWEPVAIFDANWDVDLSGTATATALRRPLYQRPTVFFAALLDRFGLAFGSGNREDLWQKVDQEARFYLFIDDADDVDPAVLPLTEGNLLRVGVADDDVGQDLLLTRAAGHKGWYLPLEEEERVITDAFALSGVTIFSSFQPAVAITEETCDPLDPGCDQLDTIECGDKQFEKDTDNLCAHAGISRNFVVGTTNADAFLYDSSGNASRYETVSTFVTSPFSEPGQNKNPDSGSGSNTDALSDVEIDIMDNLKKLFPENCRFANYRVDIKTIAADTRVERIAPIPICLVEKNWKEY